LRRARRSPAAARSHARAPRRAPDALERPAVEPRAARAERRRLRLAGARRARPGPRPREPDVRVGVQLPEVERVVRWPEVAAMARAAEEGGFASIWLGDHMLYAAPEGGPWAVWTSLAALAAITERVGLGPLVASTAFHPPGVLARMAAAVDEISDGRL